MKTSIDPLYCPSSQFRTRGTLLCVCFGFRFGTVFYSNTRIEPQSLVSGRFTFSALRVKIRARILKLLKKLFVLKKFLVLSTVPYTGQRKILYMKFPSTSNVPYDFLLIIIFSFLLFSSLEKMLFVSPLVSGESLHAVYRVRTEIRTFLLPCGRQAR
jgi:hypothetical protein